MRPHGLAPSPYGWGCESRKSDSALEISDPPLAGAEFEKAVASSGKRNGMERPKSVDQRAWVGEN